LLLLIGLSLQSAGPHGPGGLALVFIRILAAGVMVAAFYTALSLAAASLTDRRAIAAAGTFIAVFASNAVTGALVFGARAPRWLLAFSISRGPFELSRRIHGEPPLPDLNMGTLPIAIAVLSWALVAAFISWNRYRTLQVTR
jgi:ABC-2 type transport system permease protein